MSVLIGCAVTALGVVSLIHVYWAFGGSWGGMAALPQKPGGGPLFRPRMPETLTVAVGTAFLALLLLAQGGRLPFWEAGGLTRWGCLAAAGVFLIRAVGDFRYLGFFKRIRHSLFARNDTWFYSPLCLALALIFGLAAL
ncbi:DUF3995 domain-containing protein [Gorillibacterium sp. sgz5001074]|uniref:DUF3995 domain-containing protein n=1 Tax=Gorillibacterium sp. sgz5001074 TaxID=3446695 RepID=UPI003F664069